MIKNQVPLEVSTTNRLIENKLLRFSGLTDTEKNALNAKIIKAELLGNTELVAELKEKLKQGESTGSKGSHSHNKLEYYTKNKISANKEADENSLSVKEMYLQAKSSITSRDEAMRFVTSSSKMKHADDEYEDIKTKKKKQKFDSYHKTVQKDDSQTCYDCPDSIGRHLLFKFEPSFEHITLIATPYEPFIKNYVQIRSKSHATNCTLNCDEQVWSEIRQAMRIVSSFFEANYKCSVVFMETHFMMQKRAENISKRHFVIECVPVALKYEQDVRIFFHVSSPFFRL